MAKRSGMFLAIAADDGLVLASNAAPGDWTTDAPGVRRGVTLGAPPRARSASVDPTFHDGESLPDGRGNHILAAKHGSWNRSRRAACKVVRAPAGDGKVTGEHQDFMIGFEPPEGNVRGCPFGVMMAADDVLGIVWRIAHVGRK